MNLLGMGIGLLLTASGAAGVELTPEIRAGAEAIKDTVIAWRRDIHQHPELSNREFRTAKLVARHLASLRITSYNVCYTKLLRS